MRSRIHQLINPLVFSLFDEAKKYELVRRKKIMVNVFKEMASGTGNAMEVGGIVPSDAANPTRGDKMRVFQTSLAILTLIAAGSAAADSSGKWTSGREAYSKVCAYCHEKGVGPVIKEMNKSPDVVTHFVRHGNRAMPAFRRTELDDATLASIINYINSGKQP